MAIEGWSTEEAMKEMQTFGFTRAHHFMTGALREAFFGTFKKESNLQGTSRPGEAERVQ